MNIYRIGSEDDCRDLTPVDPGVDLGTMLRGLPIAASWRPVELADDSRLDAADGQRRRSPLPVCDITTSGRIVLTQRAADVLRDLIIECAELLPMHGPTGALYLVNVTRVLPALNEEESDIFSLPSAGIVDVSHYAFFESVIGSAPIFRLSLWPRGPDFVTEAFRERVLDAGLTGAIFRRIWGDETARIAASPLWERVSERLQTGSARELATLPDDVRAWYVTRLFEWYSDADGVDQFFGEVADVAPMVTAGYRHLGLQEAANAYETLFRSDPAQRLMSDVDAELSEADYALLDAMWRRVGLWDAERLAFVQSRPKAFQP